MIWNQEAYSAHAMFPSGLSIRKGCLHDAEETLCGHVMCMYAYSHA